jgi:hypothetical protein
VDWYSGSVLRVALHNVCPLGRRAQSPQNLRIDHDAGGGHEHDWNGTLLARDVLDAQLGARGLSAAAAAAQNRLGQMSCEPKPTAKHTKPETRSIRAWPHLRP